MFPEIKIEYMTKYSWSLVIEGICPLCRKEIGLTHYIPNENVTFYQCSSCERVYIDEEDDDE